MDRVVTATKRKNVFPFTSLVFLCLSVVPLFQTIEIELLLDGEPIDGLWGSIDASLLDIYGNFSVALTCFLLVGYLAFFVAAALNFLSQPRGFGIVRPIAWGGFACHLIAVLFMTSSLVCENILSRSGYLEYLDETGFSISCPMGAVKFTLIAIDVLYLVLLHMSYQYDKRVWVKRPKKIAQTNIGNL